MTEHVGAHHELIKQLRRLCGRRSSRYDERRFVVEGPVLVAELLAQTPWMVDVVLTDGSMDDITWECERSGVRHVSAPDRALSSALDTKSPRLACAIVTMPQRSYDEVIAQCERRDAAVLIAVGLSDPGNAGTIIRTAEAFGFGAVLLTQGSVDPWNPKVVRSSAGAVTRIPLVVDLEPMWLIADLNRRGYESIATSLTASASIWDIDMAQQSAVVIGNEAHGLPPEVSLACTHEVVIPMVGVTESLNASGTAAIVCAEYSRQHR